jgi:uncharacterized protein (TIGR00255 family)
MTGYGKGEASKGSRSFTVELKSVNNRFLEVNARIPKSLVFCDDIIRGVIQKRFSRGTVDVYINYENRAEDNREVIIDMALCGEYVKAAKKLRTEFMLEYDFQTTALMRSPDVLKIELTKDDPELIAELCLSAVSSAAEELERMRGQEGHAIKENLTEILKNIIASLTAVTQRAPKIVAEYRQKIEQRMREILKEVAVDETRLLNETAFFADKADVSEELQRLSSHVDQFVLSLEQNEPQGRKLDFIAQEMNREINTIGSKSNDLEITGLVIAMKNELEKLKEQIRNIE